MKSFTTFREYVLNIRSAKGRGPSFHPSFCCKSSHPFWSSAYWPKAPLKHRPTTLPLPTRSTNSLVDLCHAFVYIATSADTPVPKRNCPRGQACSFCHKTSHFVLSLPHLCLPQRKGTSSYSLWQALTLRATQIFPSQEPHATPTLKPLANTPWANLPPGKSVIMPYTSPPIKTISQTTFYISRETITRALTIQALDTDQPALLRMEANKKLGLLTLNANFKWKPPRFPSCTLRTTRTQLLAHSPVPLDTSTDKWPKPATLSMKFISQHCTLLF